VDSERAIEAALAAGADAYVLKSVEPASLAPALRQAMEKPVARAIGRSDEHLHPWAEAGLSERELDVLRELANGKSNTEIAHTLWLAEQTVKFHLTNIYRKLDVRCRTQAVHWAYSHGLVEDPFEKLSESREGLPERALALDQKH